MRIGMVTGEYPPMEGGVGAFTREVARAMVRLNHEVHIFTRRAADDASEPGIHVTASVGARWGWGTPGAIRRWAEAHKLALVNIQFQTAAFDMHPAIHWLPTSLRGTCPVVVTFHDLRAPYLFPKAGRVRAWLVRNLARDASAVIATDRADEAQLQQWGIKHVRWIPIGSNVHKQPPVDYDRAAWREQLGVGPADLLISYFGFLNESKGGLVLIEALARLLSRGVPAHLVMIGGRAGASDPANFAYGERVDACITAHGLDERVHWTGFVADEEVSAHFLASDVTALPYLDGVSLRRGTLMAALAHGRAIVTTTPQTDAPELERALVTAPPGDADRLVEAILTLWQDAEQRRGLEERALEAASLFTWESIAARTLALYEEVIDGFRW
jgi:glycosyltransferase involved in cell wall biosynthesis